MLDSPVHGEATDEENDTGFGSLAPLYLHRWSSAPSSVSDPSHAGLGRPFHAFCFCISQEDIKAAPQLEFPIEFLLLDNLLQCVDLLVDNSYKSLCCTETVLFDLSK